jgi:hypothetical protein
MVFTHSWSSAEVFVDSSCCTFADMKFELPFCPGALPGDAVEFYLRLPGKCHALTFQMPPMLYRNQRRPAGIKPECLKSVPFFAIPIPEGS